MLILVDQDSVLADFEQGFVDAWRVRGDPTFQAVPVAARTSFELMDDYPLHLEARVRSIYHAPGFYRNLRPIEGAIQAMHDMAAEGHEIFICSAPASTPHCAIEKYEWVESYLGQDYVERTILSKDKTLVRGAVLIDDKPEITGCRTPVWRHILYEQPYNLRAAGPRLTWRNWREVLRALPESRTH